MAKSPATQVGYVLIGVYINLALFGVTLVQAWLYYTRYRKDPLVLKLTVATLLGLDITNSVSDCVAIYHWLVSWYGEAEHLEKVTASFLVAVQAGAAAASMVQCFLAWRVQRLRRQWWLTLIIVAFSMCGLLGSIGTMIGLSILQYVAKWGEIQSVTLVWCIGSVICDVITTTTLVLTLRRDVNAFGNKESSMVRLKNLILQTSVLTMLVDLLHLIIVAIEPANLLHVLFCVIMPKLYINSLLSTLNTRRSGSELMAQTSSAGNNNDEPHDAKPVSALRKTLWGTWAATTDTHTEHLPEPGVGIGVGAVGSPTGLRPTLAPAYASGGADGAHVHISTVQEKDVHLDPGMLTHPLAPKRSSTDDASAHMQSDRSASIHSARLNLAESTSSPTGVVTFAPQAEHMA